MKDKNEKADADISRMKKFQRSGWTEDSGEDEEKSRPVWIDWHHTPGHDKNPL